MLDLLSSTCLGTQPRFESNMAELCIEPIKWEIESTPARPSRGQPRGNFLDLIILSHSKMHVPELTSDDKCSKTDV